MKIGFSEVLSVAALLLGIANFIMTRISARKEQGRRKRDDALKIQALLDESFDLLWGRDGYSRTKNSAKVMDAEKRIEQALAIDSLHPRAVEYEGHLFELRGDISTARERYQRSISLNPNRARPYNCLGLLAEPKEAIKYFERAVALEPSRSALYHHNLGRALVKLDRPSEAEKHFRLSLQQQPGYADAHLELAQLLKSMGNREDARSHFELAITSDAKHVWAMTSLGLLLSEKEDTWDEGIQWLEYAQKIDPTDSQPLRMMAAIYADNHHPEKAIALAEQAMAIDPAERLTGAVMHDLRKQMLNELKSSIVTQGQ
jgi:tetratricopeptide (TPR) repeat protein